MGSSESREEIVVQQQQQQTGQQQQSLPVASGIGPVHVIATCMVIIIAALLLRVIWQILMREIENRSRRSPTVATIV